MPNKTITVNGTQKNYENDSLSHEEIVVLAFGNYYHEIIYTVLYYAGKSDNVKGSLVRGESIKVHPNMVFNVTKTTQS